MSIPIQIDKIYQIIQDICSDIQLPKYLIHLLAYNGFDNIQAISLISDTSILKMEHFAREILPKLKRTTDELNDFYGIYSEAKELFEIQEGHKILLNQFVKECKTRLSCKKKRKCNCLENNTPENKRKKSEARKNILIKNRNELNSMETTEELSEDSEISEDNKLKLKEHIERLVSNYVKKFCTEYLKEDERQDILGKIKNINVTVNNNNTVSVPCLICNFISKAYGIKRRGKYQWTLSNFNKHLKTHFKNVKLPSNDENIQQRSLMSYFTVTNTASQTKSASLEERSASEKVTVIEDISQPNSQNSENLTIFSTEESFSNSTTDELNDFTNLDFCLNRSFKETRTSVIPFKSSHQSRHIRHLNKLNTVSLDLDQTKLTDFYDIVRNVQCQLDKNTEIKSAFSQNTKFGINFEEGTENKLNFLEILKRTAVTNSTNKTHGNRFSEPLKLFSLYIFIIGGRIAYQTLYSNLKGTLPSISTLNRCLDGCSKVLEGVLRFNELKDFLDKRNYGSKIFISEDQTAIVRRIYYDPRLNKMIGFVLPISEKYGFPVTDNSYIVTSIADIKKAFAEAELSNNAYVYMAQPLVDKAPAFCLIIFGSNNRFTANDVLHRWNTLLKEGKKYKIEIMGFSSDGDTRCLKSMRKLSGISSLSIDKETVSPYAPFFQAHYNLNEPVYIQDTVHIATKMKTRLLKPGIYLPMGDYCVSTNFIETIVKTYPKDQHLLCMSYLKSEDKMNFEAIDRLSATCVTNILETIKESAATKQYLILVRYILSAFLDKNITVLERLYFIWFVTFFLRFWRKWLQMNNYSIVENFLTTNTYTCIELNAHGLLLFIDKCRENNSPECFVPWLFSSQPCEKLFRQTRSMTSTFATVVNYGISDMLKRLNRIQALNEISVDIDDIFQFPREEPRRLGDNETLHIQVLPSISDINDILKKAREDVLISCEELGMRLDDHVKVFEEVSIKKIVDEESEDDNDVDRDVEECDNACNSDTENEEIKNDISILSKINKLHLKDYKDSQLNVNVTSPFLKVIVGTENRKNHIVVRKSSLCWLFSEKNNLSCDRNLRVRGMGTNSKKCNIYKKKSSKTDQNHKSQSQRKINTKNKSYKESAINSTDSETSETSSFEYSEKSDTDTEIFSSDEDRDEGSVSEINVRAESYYCVFFDHNWYPGRVLEVMKDSNKCKIKFLKADLDVFIWPSTEDVHVINKDFIFYGPLNLIGNGPFKIKRNEINLIKKKYKELKKSL